MKIKVFTIATTAALACCPIAYAWDPDENSLWLTGCIKGNFTED